MDYLSLNVLHIIKNIIVFIIFLVAFLLLLRKKSEFKTTLDAELMKNHYNMIYSRLATLEELNTKTFHMVKQMDRITDSQRNGVKPIIHTSNPLQYLSDKKSKPVKPAETQLTDYRLSQPKNGIEDQENLNCNFGKSKIQEIMHMPKAEADFMLKFNRLYQLNQHKNYDYMTHASVRP